MTDGGDGTTCDYCGNGYGPSDVVCPTCSFPTPRARGSAAAAARRRRRLARTVAAGVVAVVLVGSVVLLLDGDEEVAPAAPVAEGPLALDVAWETDLGSSVLTTLGLADAALLVSTDGADLVLLDAAGERTWQVDGPAPAPRLGVDETGEVLVAAADGPGITALDAADGTALWTYPDITYVDTVAAGVVVDVEAEGGPFGVLDALSGEPTWSVPDVDAYAVAGETAYVLRGDALTALDAADGSERWSVQVGRGGPRAGLVATDDVVAVSSPDGPTLGLDPADGTQRWTVPGDASLRVLSDSRVLVTTAEDGLVLDGDGEVGSLPPGTASGPSADVEGFEVDGQDQLLVGTTVLGPDLAPLVRYSGVVAPAADGVWVVDGARLTHHALGETDADAALDLTGPAGDVVVLDGLVVLVDGSTLTGVR